MDEESDADYANYFKENRKHWEELMPKRYDSMIDAVYRGEEFLDGETALLPIEREELGDVAGKKLLDLQCHVGVRTLSLAREGATVTGVDISSEAIDLSRELAAETELEDRATFIEANIYDLPEIHDERYDVVFTNFGVLCWLPDIERWADVVTAFLEPGGTFYLAEYHPLTDALSFDRRGDETTMTIEHPYFSMETPATMDDGPPYKWTRGLGETLTALIDAGIELEFVHEHPFSPLELFPGMVEDENGYWRFEDIDLPLVVTVKGTMKES